MERYWQGKPQQLEHKPFPVPLCLPQIPNGLIRAQTRASAERPETNRLSHGTEEDIMLRKGTQLTSWATISIQEGLSPIQIVLLTLGEEVFPNATKVEGKVSASCHGKQK
jgi:hypothetical protein